MKIDIENISEEEGKKIAKAIMKRYDEYSYSYKTQKVEKEIYERSLHNATTFFLSHDDAKFDNEIIETLQLYLQARLQNPKKIKKLKPEEMLANVIKIYVIDFLLEWDGIVI